MAGPNSASSSSDPSVDSVLRAASATSLADALTFTGNDRFEVVRYLGRGGFGSVYEVRDRNASGAQAVALKMLRRPHAERLARFKREFRDLAELRHPNLVQLYELVADDNAVYFTMELVRGESPLSYVRKRADRARELVRGLATGLGALHRAGRLHRDIKPSNILVEPDGRVVLLDFGLAAEIGAASDDAAGTPLYMSPEQCAHDRLSEASDWYAVGLVLFQALTGRLPFVGELDEVTHAKLHSEAPRASGFADVPVDLDELCAALLARDPERRPRGDAQAGASREVFVGREAEQQALAQWFEDSTRACTVALALGTSGIGKTALLRRFLDDVRRRRPDTLVLAGRCFERESVPYKALDAIIDELARRLSRMPSDEVAALLPRDADALATLFPVLQQIPSIASVRGRAHEVRGRGLAALRTLFARLAARSPVIVCIDDLQWGDADSAAVFAELVRGPDAPAVFWLAGIRDEERTTSPFMSRLAGVEIRELRLEALGSAQAAQLAAALLGAGDERADMIAAESQGNPFFVHELARVSGGAHALDSLVQQRVAQLDRTARSLLELVAIAARPIELELVTGAVGGDLLDALSCLRAEHLIRARDANQERRIECYHDRIREAVVASIAPGDLRANHLALAAALERSDASPAQIGWHLAEGGERARAHEYFRRGAEHAASALAFEDAAQLYRRALALMPDVGIETELAYAEVLSAAGHGREAARVWMSLVDRVDNAERRIDLRRRATEELLLCGEVEQGYEVMTALLAELDLAFPRSTASAVARVVSGRIGLALSGRRLRARATPATERELMRIDTLAGLAWAVVQQEPLIGYALQTQHLRLALRSGDRQRAAVALWIEAPVGAMRGAQGVEYTRRTLEAARALTDEANLPVAVTRTIEGIVALFEGRWHDGIEHLDVAERAPNNSTIGHGSMRGSIYAMRAMILYWMGRSGDLLRQLPAQRRDLEEHGNVYGRLWLDLLEAWALSCSGRVDEAWAASESVRARLPERIFQLHRWYLEYGQVKFLLLAGKADDAWQRLGEVRRRMRFAMTGHAQRVAGHWVHAVVALGRASALPATRGAMLAEARRMVRRIEDERVPWTDAIARALAAQIARVAGSEYDAARLFAEAEQLLDTHHLESLLAIVRREQGAMLGGAEGRTLIAQADTWMKEQNIDVSIGRVLLGTE